jgi:hypothetical protein
MAERLAVNGNLLARPKLGNGLDPLYKAGLKGFGV